jgi:hypothetical protein
VVKVFDENSFENGILKTEKPVLVHAYQEENAKHKNWDTLVTKYKYKIITIKDLCSTITKCRSPMKMLNL